MSGHVSPIIVSGYIMQSRRASELEIGEANARFDRALDSCEWAWEAFWASCEKDARDIKFVQISSNGEVFEFRDGWLLEAKK